MRRAAPALAVLAGLLALPQAQAAEVRVVATVAPVLGLGIDAHGLITAPSGSTDYTVTEERAGDSLTITVIPR